MKIIYEARIGFMKFHVLIVRKNMWPKPPVILINEFTNTKKRF